MRENNARKISMGDMFTDFLVMHRQKQGRSEFFYTKVINNSAPFFAFHSDE
jgi:hypothetical protein